MLGRGRIAGLAVGPRGRVDRGGERGEDRVEAFDRPVIPADHHAVAAVETPDAAARPAVDVVDPLVLELLGAVNIIDIIGVAPVDQDVILLEQRPEFGQHLVDHAGRDHHPDGARLLELVNEVLQGSGPGRPIPLELVDRFGVGVENHALVPTLDQAADHVGSHPPQTDHPELHREAPSKKKSRPCESRSDVDATRFIPVP